MDSRLAHSMEELEKLFSSRMEQYEEKLQRATAGSDSTHSDLASLSKDFTDFKYFVCKTLSHFKTQVELLSSGLDSHETAMRRKVLLFHGIPERPGEKLCDRIYEVISNQLKIDDFKTDYLSVCHRLGPSQGKTRPVLVRFNEMEHRRLVWDNKTSLKGSGTTISEFLTKTRHQVFMAARKHFSINSCWSAEGNIIVMTPDRSRRKIASMGELLSLIALFPTAASASSSNVPEPAASASPAAAATLPKTATPRAKVMRRARR